MATRREIREVMAEDIHRVTVVRGFGGVWRQPRNTAWEMGESERQVMRWERRIRAEMAEAEEAEGDGAVEVEHDIPGVHAGVRGGREAIGHRGMETGHGGVDGGLEA